MTATFPQAPLDLKIGIQLTSGSWTDITSYAYQRDGTGPPVTITRGRPKNSSQVSPASMNTQVNNRDGRFTAANPMGAYYGLLGKNTPIRASAPAQGTYLRMEGDQQSLASCPGGAGLQITGNLDVRIDLALSGWPSVQSSLIWQTAPQLVSGYAGLWTLDYWAATLISQWTTSGNQRAWALLLQPDGTLLLAWSPDGTLASAVLAVSDLPVPQGRGCLRATLTASTGVVAFYTAAAGNADTGPWTQLGGSAGGAGSTSVFSTSTAPVKAGYSSGMATDQSPNGGTVQGMTGAVWEAEVRNGISGTVLAHPVFSAQTAGAGSFTDAQGNTWSTTGTAELSNRSYRFHGEMSSAPKAQDPSGTDIWVPYSCGGILRRLSQNASPVQSPMTRGLLAQSGSLACVALWPGEDLQGAKSIGSAIGGPLMTISGSPQMASDSSFAGASALPVLSGSTWYGDVPAYTSNGSIILRFLLNVQTAPNNSSRIIRIITTGTCSEVSLYYASGGGLGLAGFNSGGTVFDTGGVAGFNVIGQPMWISVELQPSGGNVDYSVVSLIPGANSGQATSGSYSGTVGNATSVIPNPYGQCGQVTLGMISVQSAWESLFDLGQPLNAWIGETAGNRYARLCNENGIAARVYGAPLVSAAMGAQPAGTLPDLLAQCEAADQGMQYEPRQAYALGYRTLASLLNQAPAVTLDWTVLKQLAWAGWQPPEDDDQLTVNDWTLTRDSGTTAGQSGASYRAVLDDGSAMSISPPPAGVGDYASSGSVNVQADTQLPDLASWLVHMGTVTGDRYPAIPVDLARPAVSALYYALQELNIGDYIAVQNAPAWLTYDLIRQLAAGVTEELGGLFYRLTFNAVPEKPYETGIFDDPVRGRADTDGSATHASFTSTATSFQVDTTASGAPLWTTAAADFPFDIAVAGERMTVTNITGASSPQTFTVTRSVNGVVKSHQAGEDVRLFFTPVYALA